MKKFNKNILVFVFAMLFIIFGTSRGYLSTIYHSVKDLCYGITQGNVSSITDFKANIDDLGKAFRYHHELMDINSVKENLIGTRIIEKDDSTVVKSDSDSLFYREKKIAEQKIDKVILKIEELKNISEENGANFLYCAAPTKAYYLNTPQNIVNFGNDNFNYFLTSLSKKVPCLDFTKVMSENNISDDDIFFLTDHHWRPYSGFISAKAICEELNLRYGFEYNEEYTDISNYKVEKYENWFLGSLGKKVGTFFSSKGADDFDLITPKFDTDFTEKQPAKNQIRNGKFEDTVLYMENMNKDYYGVNTYATYSGGDFRLQIIKNNMNQKGKKILIVRDSFACVTAPFLALQTSELHICDMRDYEYYVGSKLNMEEYIKEIKPDYVLVLYSGISDIDNANGRYDFF